MTVGGSSRSTRFTLRMTTVLVTLISMTTTIPSRTTTSSTAQASPGTNILSGRNIPCANKLSTIQRNIRIQKVNRFLLETNLTEKKNYEDTTAPLTLLSTRSSRSPARTLSLKTDHSKPSIKSGIPTLQSLKNISSTVLAVVTWTRSRVSRRRVSTVTVVSPAT